MPGGKSEKMLTLLTSIQKVLCSKTISFDICKLFKNKNKPNGITFCFAI